MPRFQESSNNDTSFFPYSATRQGDKDSRQQTELNNVLSDADDCDRA